MTLTGTEREASTCNRCGKVGQDCPCDDADFRACAVEDCATGPVRYVCGWCDRAICGAHANDFSGLCPDCQAEYEADN